jgi:hypothetical protein
MLLHLLNGIKYSYIFAHQYNDQQIQNVSFIVSLSTQAATVCPGACMISMR